MARTCRGPEAVVENPGEHHYVEVASVPSPDERRRLLVGQTPVVAEFGAGEVLYHRHLVIAVHYVDRNDPLGFPAGHQNRNRRLHGAYVQALAARNLTTREQRPGEPEVVMFLAGGEPARFKLHAVVPVLVEIVTRVDLLARLRQRQQTTADFQDPVLVPQATGTRLEYLRKEQLDRGVAPLDLDLDEGRTMRIVGRNRQGLHVDVV